jgi:hypothetical protein
VTFVTGTGDYSKSPRAQVRDIKNSYRPPHFGGFTDTFFEAPWFSCRKEQAAKGRYASQRVDAFRPVRGFNSAAKNLILLPVLARVASKELS